MFVCWWSVCWSVNRVVRRRSVSHNLPSGALANLKSTHLNLKKIRQDISTIKGGIGSQFAVKLQSINLSIYQSINLSFSTKKFGIVHMHSYDWNPFIWSVKFPYEPSWPPVGWLVRRRSVIITYECEKLHFHAPIGPLIHTEHMPVWGREAGGGVGHGADQEAEGEGHTEHAAEDTTAHSTPCRGSFKWEIER